MRFSPLLSASLALCVLALAGCTTAKLAVHIVKSISTESEQTRPLPHAARGHYKLGKPYEVRGVRYHPNYDPRYDRTGIASWYGPTFHGRRTANGERFDMNEVTAAHPTLPLPSRVRVTNLENGRQLVLRVNDRGPFVDGRVIDVSRRAAQLLGFYRKGLARVRVQYLGLDSLDPDVPVPAERPIVLAAEGPRVAFKPRPAERAAAAGVQPPVKPVSAAAGGAPRGLLVEAAVLDRRDAADRLGARVRSFGAVAVAPERRGGRLVYAVRIGPVDSDDEAASILARLVRAGLKDSHIIAAGYR